MENLDGKRGLEHGSEESFYGKIGRNREMRRERLGNRQ